MLQFIFHHPSGFEGGRQGIVGGRQAIVGGRQRIRPRRESGPAGNPAPRVPTASIWSRRFPTRLWAGMRAGKGGRACLRGQAGWLGPEGNGGASWSSENLAKTQRT